jgi:hypothetical protein
MKAILILLAMAFLLVLTGNVVAAPFVVCDSYVPPMDVPDYFKASLDGGTETQSPVWSGTAGGQTFTNAIHYDLAGVSVGVHVIQIKACNAPDPIWNTPEACTAPVPLPFTRPAVSGSPPSAPSGGRLVP